MSIFQHYLTFYWLKMAPMIHNLKHRNTANQNGGLGAHCVAHGLLESTTNLKQASPSGTEAIILPTKKHLIKSSYFSSTACIHPKSLLHSSISMPSGKSLLIPSFITPAHLYLSALHLSIPLILLRQTGEFAINQTVIHQLSDLYWSIPATWSLPPASFHHTVLSSPLLH